MDCSICLDNEKYTNISTLCKHEFHKDCLDTWLSENKNCPYCRKSLTDYIRDEIEVGNLEEDINELEELEQRELDSNEYYREIEELEAREFYTQPDNYRLNLLYNEKIHIRTKNGKYRRA